MQQYDSQSLLQLPPTSESTWIVEGIFRTNYKRPALLCGLGEVGKSTLAVQLAISVAQGRPFLGRETQKSKVVYWKYEDTAEDACDDFAKAGMRKGDPIEVLIPQAGDKNLECLGKALSEHPDTRLVIIETILDFLNIPDSNSTEAVKTTMKKFNDAITEKYRDCVFLLLHHFNKGEVSASTLSITKINGSHAFATTTGAKIYLNRVSDSDPRRIVYATARKGRELEPTYLKFDPATNTSTLDITVYQERTLQKEQNRLVSLENLDERILHIVNDNPGLSKRALAAKIGGKTQKVLLCIDGLLQQRFLVAVEKQGRGGTIQTIYCVGQQPAEVGDTPTSDELTLLDDFDSAENKEAFFNKSCIEERRVLDKYRADSLPTPF